MTQRLVRDFNPSVVEIFNSEAGRWNYYVPNTDLKTRRGLIKVLYFLSQKPWITPEHIKQLLELANERYGHSLVKNS